MKNTIQETSLSKETTFYFKNLSILQNLGNIAQTLTPWEISNLEKALGKVDLHYIDAMYAVLIKRYFPSIERSKEITAKKQLKNTVTNILIAFKAQKNIQLSAYDFFVLYQHCQQVQPLLTLQFSSEPPITYVASFSKIIQNCYPTVWNILQKNASERSDRAENALRYLFENNNPAEIRLLLDYQGQKASEDTKTFLLKQTAIQGNFAFMKLLLSSPFKKLFSTESKGWALRDASWNQHLNIVKLLLEPPFEKAIDAEHRGNALHYAAWRRELEMVKLLLTYPFGEPIALDHKHMTLRTLADHGPPQIMEILVDHLPTKPIVTIKKTNPLYNAAKEGNVEAVMQLISDPAGEELKYAAYKREALHIAAQHHHLAIVKLLLTYPFEPISAEVKGQELVCSAKTGDLEIVRLLLEHTSLEPISAEWKQTALTEAEENGHAHIMTLLCAHLSLQAPFRESHRKGGEVWTRKVNKSESLLKRR